MFHFYLLLFTLLHTIYHTIYHFSYFLIYLVFLITQPWTSLAFKMKHKIIAANMCGNLTGNGKFLMGIIYLYKINLEPRTWSYYLFMTDSQKTTKQKKFIYKYFLCIKFYYKYINKFYKSYTSIHSFRVIFKQIGMNMFFCYSEILRKYLKCCCIFTENWAVLLNEWNIYINW